MRLAGAGKLGAFAAVLVVLVGVILVPAAGSAGTPPSPQHAEENVLHAAFASFPDYLDPQLSYTAEGWTAMYDTYIPLLTFRHASGRAGSDLIPGLAKAMPKVTDGGRTFTLFLRRGLKYSNGRPVRASDFEYTVERLLKMHSGGAPFFTWIVGADRYGRVGKGGIKGIATDNKSGRIVIHLAAPSSTFPYLLATPFAALVPAGTPMRDQTFSPAPATGPYAISKADFEGWTYVRNPAWARGNGRLMPQLPAGHVDGIDVRVVRNAVAEAQGVIDGRFDWMQNPPATSQFEAIRRRYAGTQLRLEPGLSTYYFWMNTKNPPFSDRRIRRAANFAVDRRALQRIYAGQMLPTQQVLPPGMPGYRRFAPYSYDLRKARRLIAAADPSDRRITVWADNEAPNLEATEYFCRQLRAIGFHVRLKVLGSISYFSVIGKPTTPNLDAGWSDWFADFPHPEDFFRPLLGPVFPRNNNNFAQMEVPAFDAEVDRLGRLQLGPTQEKAYAGLDRRYTRLAPWIAYGNRVLTTFVAKGIDLDGVVWNPMMGADLASFRFD